MCIEDLFYNTKDFKIQLKEIGEGGFGKVYVSQNIKDGKQYATKIIKLNDEFNEHNQMLLMRESLIHQQLNHPGVVKFKGLNFQSSSDPTKFEPSIITEYLPNGSLRGILKKERTALAPIDWSSTKKNHYINWDIKCDEISSRTRNYISRSKARKYSFRRLLLSSNLRFWIITLLHEFG